MTTDDCADKENACEAVRRAADDDTNARGEAPYEVPCGDSGRIPGGLRGTEGLRCIVGRGECTMRLVEMRYVYE